MTVRIIATGGTFDKRYNPISGSLGFGKSQLPKILDQARIRSPFVLEELPLMDSLDMIESDRIRIVNACSQSPENKIVVVHGTDTMLETATLIAIASMNKTIVLTGAMIPFQIEGSDAFFNLGFAYGVTQLLPPDVYVAMNGRIFRWDQVRKNKSEGIFESNI